MRSRRYGNPCAQSPQKWITAGSTGARQLAESTDSSQDVDSHRASYPEWRPHRARAVVDHLAVYVAGDRDRKDDLLVHTAVAHPREAVVVVPLGQRPRIGEDPNRSRPPFEVVQAAVEGGDRRQAESCAPGRDVPEPEAVAQVLPADWCHRTSLEKLPQEADVAYHERVGIDEQRLRERRIFDEPELLEESGTAFRTQRNLLIVESSSRPSAVSVTTARGNSGQWRSRDLASVTARSRYRLAPYAVVRIPRHRLPGPAALRPVRRSRPTPPLGREASSSRFCS